MTGKERKQAVDVIMELIKFWPLVDMRGVLIRDYMSEHERMRKFIRNVVDESRVYLGSDE